MSGRGRSASVVRVTQVIEALAAEPERQFRLSDLTADLSISSATLHSLVTTLCDVGWLIRNPSDKTVSLGSRLILAGRAAERSFPALRLAEAEAQRLSDEFAVVCTVSAPLDSTVQVMAVATGAGTQEGSVEKITNRIPLAAPFGSPFVAWLDDAEIEEWLQRGSVPFPDEERRQILDALADIRLHRVGAERLTDFGRLQEVIAASTDDVSADTRARLSAALPELARRRTMMWSEVVDSSPPAPLGMVFAPIGDETGTVILNLGIHLREPEPPATLGSSATVAARGAADRVMREIGGRLGPPEVPAANDTRTQNESPS